MLGRLQKKTSYYVLFTGRTLAVSPSSASFAGDGCVRDIVVLYLKLTRIASLNVARAQISKQTQ